MTRGNLMPMALAAIVGGAAVTVEFASAAEPQIAVMKVISSSMTARFVPLGLNRSVVIDMPADIRDVLVSNPKIANAVMKSKRRVYIIGTEVGATNIFFFDADGRQIGGLDIGVSSDQQLSPPVLENSSIASNSITIYRGMDHMSQECTQGACTQPPNTPTPSSSQSTTTTSLKNAQGNTIGTGTSNSTTTGP